MRWLSRRSPEAPPKGRHAAGRPTPTIQAPPTQTSAAPGVPPQQGSEYLLEAAPAPDHAPPAAAPEPARSGVYLGFADGSGHELAAGDPRVGAFWAVARTLVGG